MRTDRQFWEVAESWYQRTHRLREVTESDNETPERKSKALKLFLIMAGRMRVVSQIAIKINTPNPPQHFKVGGI